MEINKIYNENCLDTMARMPDSFIDLTVTSPPYDNLRKYNGYSFQFEKIAQEIYRVTKIGGIVVWIVNDQTTNGSESLTSFKQAIFFNKIGFNVYDTMIYSSQKPPLTHRRYEQEFEFMFVFCKGTPNVFNPIKVKNKQEGQIQGSTFRHKGLQTEKLHLNDPTKSERIKGNIWRYETGNNLSTKDEIAFKHPAIFPEQLAKDHIFSWSNKGDLVYDPFGGSGTTAKASHLMERNWILSEISPEYVEIANKRLDPYLRQMAFSFFIP